MTPTRTRRHDQQPVPEGDQTEADGGGHVQVRVLTRSPALALLTAAVAVVYLADSRINYPRVRRLPHTSTTLEAICTKGITRTQAICAL